MCDRLSLYVIVLVFCQVIGSCAACGAKAGHSYHKGSESHSQQALHDPQVTAKSDRVRFVVEHAKTPEPGVRGAIVDAQHAWVIGPAPNYLLRTINGGKTWEAMYPLSEDEPRFGRMRDMYVRTFFVSSTRGWLMANSGTWQTDDGGLTWWRLFPKGFDDIQFADEGHGWMSVADDRVRHQQSYITEDGGQNWSPCGSPRVYVNRVPTHAYFSTPSIAWSITTNTDEEDARISTKGVAQSTDGGCSWNQLWENPDADAKYYDIYFLNEREGWLAGEQSLLHTSDGGRSWSETSRPHPDANVIHVHFVNPREGWIVGAYSSMTAGDTGVFRTADAGKHWRQLSEREIGDGFQEGNRLIELPEQWRAGKLLQLLYKTRVAERTGDVAPPDFR